MKATKIVRSAFSTVLFAAMSLVFVGCPQNPSVTPQPPVITDQDKCQAACDNLKHLGCVEGQPIDMHTPCTADNQCGTGQACSALGTCMTPCVTFCVDTENNGVWLDPVCVAGITKCSDIDSCPAAQPKPNACNENSCPMPSR